MFSEEAILVWNILDRSIVGNERTIGLGVQQAIIVVILIAIVGKSVFIHILSKRQYWIHQRAPVRVGVPLMVYSSTAVPKDLNAVGDLRSVSIWSVSCTWIGEWV